MVIGELIVCRPYDKPDKHYEWNPDSEDYDLVDGRRKAGYQSMSEAGDYDPVMHEIKHIQTIREKVDRWREDSYLGARDVTRELLRHWADPEREKRLFFCQLEAIETLIYMTEINSGLAGTLDGFQSDKSDFSRLCSKLATGTGKTVIMGMLIAWQLLNPKSNVHTHNILVVSPGLTVRERLQVLRPSHEDNIYDEFDLVPHDLRHLLDRGCIAMTNYHALDLKGSKKSEKAECILKIGKELPRHMAKRLFGETVKDVLVINDEGHHAWRPDSYDVRGRQANKDAKQAGLWMKGLDMIHEACGITRCHDFSATPFVPTGKASGEDALFTWIASDFSLSDSIESGLVKTPQAVSDADESKYRHIYSDSEVRKHFRDGKGLHDSVRTAYRMMGNDWKKRRNVWKSKGETRPPVMISVCNSIRDAEQVHEAMLKNEAQLPDELWKDGAVMRIDSKEKEKANDKKSVEELTRKINTIGRKNEPGEKICNIVSVNMLTEGWDVKTVTHIVGLRAFTSQLLCEQVVGRGLRRTSYDLDGDGKIKPPEYVTVIGVPFGFLPFEASDPAENGNTPLPPREVKPESKRVNHAIGWPDAIIGSDMVLTTLDADVEKMDEYKLVEAETVVRIGPVVDGKPGPPRKTLVANSHRQTVAFGVLKDLGDRMHDKWVDQKYDLLQANPYRQYIDGLSMIDRFLDSKIRTKIDGDARWDAAGAQVGKIAEHLAVQIRNVELGMEGVPDIRVKGVRSTKSLKPRYTTSRYTMVPKKCHLSLVSASVNFELEIARELDASRRVTSWVKADMVGFSIQYDDPVTGAPRQYRPDFIVHLDDGVQLVLEGKGEKRDAEVKRRALDKWVKAVNASNYPYGIWDHDIVWKRDATGSWKRDLTRILSKKRSSRIERTCYVCVRTENEHGKVMEVFGYEKTPYGIVEIPNICKACAGSVCVSDAAARTGA